MIIYLKDNFHATQAKDPKSSLAIRSGKGGARLSHDHSKQYAYVMQSLTLWREILHGEPQLPLPSHFQLLMKLERRHVSSVVIGGTRPALREDILPPARHGAGAQPRAARAQDLAHDARDLAPRTEERGHLGRERGHPHGR